MTTERKADRSHHQHAWLVAVVVTLIAGRTMEASSFLEDGDVDHSNVAIDLAPSGRSIVFSSAGGDLYTFDLRTLVAKRLTRTSRIESFPSFSPDGKRIVFAASKPAHNSPYELFLFDREKERTVKLTVSNGTCDILPRFAPDSKSIVFARSRRRRRASLGGFRWDHWDVAQISVADLTITSLTHERYSELDRICPLTDGTLFFSAASQHPESLIKLYRLSNRGEIRVAFPVRDQRNNRVNAWAAYPMIGPNEKRLVFVNDARRQFWYDICVWERSGRFERLTTQSRYSSYPDFFPDGKNVIFLSGQQFNSRNQPIFSLRKVSIGGKSIQIAPPDLFTNPQDWIKRKSQDRH